MVKIVGVKFLNSCKTYYFDPQDELYEVGEGVIVETSRGTEYAIVQLAVKEVDDSEITKPLKPVLRRASKKENERVSENEKKVPWVVETAKNEVEKLGLTMKITGAEFEFDGSKIIIYFTAPERVDFRELVKVLVPILHHKIELKQIGPRDEAKILGGIAPCGRVCCCNSFLPDFKTVSMKMAKNQGLSLNPSKISGLCGKLMCCLEYENEPYAEAYKKMPKIGSEVTTPDGKAIVISNNMLKMIVKTKAFQKDGTLLYNEYPLDAVKFTKKGEPEKEEEGENN